MKSLVARALFEPLAAVFLLVGAASLAFVAPTSPFSLALTGLLCGALLRGLLPVNLGEAAMTGKRWQRVGGVHLASSVEWSCLLLAVAGAVTAAMSTQPDLREASAWLATTAVSFRFAPSLPVWAPRG